MTGAQAMKVSSAKTLNGQELRVSNHDGTLMVNESTVLNADVPASNGVIHVVDTVLLPGNN